MLKDEVLKAFPASEFRKYQKEVLEKMAEYNDLVPLHNPPYIRAVRIFQTMFPDLPLVGLFEPAFHVSIPDYAVGRTEPGQQ